MTRVAPLKPSLTQPDIPLPLESLRAWTPLCVALGLMLTALLLWGRRLSGALEQPLPAAPLWLAGIVLAGFSEYLRHCLTSRYGKFWFIHGTAIRRANYSLGWLPVLAAWLIAAAISLPGSPGSGLAGLWVCLSLAGVWATWRQLRNPTFFVVEPPIVPRMSQEPFLSTFPPDASVPTVIVDDEAAADGPSDFDSGEASMADEELSPDVMQQFIRQRDPAGDEWITGMVRVAVEPGQKTAHAHVAFCPPFLTPPACEAEVMSGPEAELKVGQVLSQGARFDVRLAECPSEPIDLLIEFAAHWQPRGT